MTIRDHVRGTLGESYSILTKDGAYDATDKPDTVAAQIARAIARLCDPGTTEADITSEFARAYLADQACHYLIPQLIDYVMQRMSESDSIGPVPGGSAGNSLMQAQTRQFYDRIAALEKLDEMLKQRLLDDLATFLDEIGDVEHDAVLVGPRISTMGHLRTEDPRHFPRIGPRHCGFISPFGGESC